MIPSRWKLPDSNNVSFLYTFQEVLLPADGIAGNVASSDPEAVVGPVPSDQSSQNYPKKSIKSAIFDRRTNGKRYSIMLYWR